MKAKCSDCGCTKFVTVRPRDGVESTAHACYRCGLVLSTLTMRYAALNGIILPRTISTPPDELRSEP